MSQNLSGEFSESSLGLRLAPAPYPESDAPECDYVLEQFPLDPNLSAITLQEIRVRIASLVAQALLGTNVSVLYDVRLVATELVANAANLDMEGLDDLDDVEDVQTKEEPTTITIEIPPRHATGVIIGRRAGQLILGVSDDTPYWIQNPRRHGTHDPNPDESSDSDNSEVSEAELMNMGMTGRGSKLVKSLASSATYSKNQDNSGKTVWAIFDLAA